MIDPVNPSPDLPPPDARPESGPGATDPRLDETMNLIGSNKVEGADVRRSSGERIGQIRWLMIEKATGKVAYVVMSFGGFMTIGESFFPIPWDALRYDSQSDAYILDVSDEQLLGAPHFADESSYDWSRAEGRRVNDFYGLPTNIQGDERG